jgi:hypothetical protein
MHIVLTCISARGRDLNNNTLLMLLQLMVSMTLLCSNQSYMMASVAGAWSNSLQPGQALRAQAPSSRWLRCANQAAASA